MVLGKESNKKRFGCLTLQLYKERGTSEEEQHRTRPPVLLSSSHEAFATEGFCTGRPYMELQVKSSSEERL